MKKITALITGLLATLAIVLAGSGSAQAITEWDLYNHANVSIGVFNGAYGYYSLIPPNTKWRVPEFSRWVIGSGYRCNWHNAGQAQRTTYGPTDVQVFGSSLSIDSCTRL